MLAWDIFSFTYLAMSWITITKASSHTIRSVASRDDANLFIIFIIVLAATIASLYAVLVVLRTKEHLVTNKESETVIYLMSIFCSWVLLHTLFTFRYAHIYYGDHATAAGTHAGGLIIPGNETPDYLDFAYFSFVLGMTYQVSDITITTQVLRRLVLLHSVLSFGFNTLILALTVNEVLSV